MWVKGIMGLGWRLVWRDKKGFPSWTTGGDVCFFILYYRYEAPKQQAHGFYPHVGIGLDLKLEFGRASGHLSLWANVASVWFPNHRTCLISGWCALKLVREWVPILLLFFFFGHFFLGPKLLLRLFNLIIAES